jgi:hypothetical protein
MNKHINFIGLTIVLITGSLGSGLAWSEVEHNQINELNLLVNVKNDDWQPSTGKFENGLIIPATWVEEAGITLDGKATEPNWSKSEEISVPLFYGDADKAHVQALYTDDNVYIKLRWKDTTENRQHHPWIWDEGKQTFVAGPQVEDSLILSFEAHCEWTPSFLSGYGYDFDGWQWLAARSDPLGQAVDIEGNVKTGYPRKPPYEIYTSRNVEKIWNVKFIDYGDDSLRVVNTAQGKELLHAPWNELDRVYLLQPVDETATTSFRMWPDGNILRPVTQVVETLAPPEATTENQAGTHPQFKPLKLEGNAGEVKAKGHWADGYWTVEFQRALVTPIGIQDDTYFIRLTQFSIHTFDHVEKIDKASESKRLFLQFMEKESPEAEVLLTDAGK